MTTQLTKSLLVLLVLLPIVRGQSRPAQPSVKAHEQRTIREERTNRALGLVEEIVDETRSLKLPESRIRIEIAMVELLWSKDEKRAQSLFKEAVATLSELTAATNSGDPDYLNMAHLPGQLRQEMLQVMTSHDPKLALDFLRATRPGSSDQQAHNGQPAGEAQLEMSVAVELVGKDPAEALSIGEAALKNGLDYNVINLLTALQSKDRPTAHKLLAAILNRLRTEDFSRNGTASYVALELLRNWIDRNRNRSSQASEQAGVDLSPPILDDQAARELSTIVIKALLDDGAIGFAGQRFARGRGPDVAQQLIALISDMGTVSPGQAGVLRKRLAELERINEAQNGPWAKYQKLVESGTAEALLEASKSAPPEIADHLVQNAAWKALNEGNEERAREIVERIANPRQRAEMAFSLDRHVLNQAGQQQEFAKHRTLLSRIPLVEERARLLVQWAVNATLSGDKGVALELLAEAEALLGNRVLNYSQLGAQLQIAQAYGKLDPGKRAGIVETAIARLNELAVAASVLNGFDLQQYFRGGEFVINGGNPLNSSTHQLAVELGSLARDDFARARSLAEQFERREMRLMALLQIAREGLSNDN